jgi:ribonucleoside-diphosphate reductase alpha chain
MSLYTIVSPTDEKDHEKYFYLTDKKQVIPHPEIALCILAAYNLGTIKHLSDLEDYARSTVRFLDDLISYQEYPIKAAEYSNLRRRPLGIGVINYAYYLAKNGSKYSDEAALKLTHELFEAMSFYSIKASMELAKERGACEGYHETKWSKGWLPIDTYKKTVDEFANFDLLLDWEWLRGEIKLHGIRNSTLLAVMPSETSSQISNATNGIEPPKDLISFKSSKDGNLKQVVPEVNKYKNTYETAWQIPSNACIIKLVAIMSKFVDQAISTNLYYDPRKYEGGIIPMKDMLTDFFMTVKYGIKNLYYQNTYDENSQEVVEDESKPAADSSDDDCGDACKI